MTLYCPINLPAGYELVRAAWLAPDVHTTMWLVPGGDAVYVHSGVTEAVTATEDYWERTLLRIQCHVASRQLGLVAYAKGVSTYAGAALSDRPPPNQKVFNVQTIIDQPQPGAATESGTGSERA